MDICNEKLKTYIEEVKRLNTEANRLTILKDAVLTVACQELDHVYSDNRLDYSHLSNGISAYKSGDLDSMHFCIVDQTIKDILLYNEYDFIFEKLAECSNTCEFYYKHISDMMIVISIPYVRQFTPENIESMDWGVIKAYRTKITDNGEIRTPISYSDDCEVINIAIKTYLHREDDVIG